jgi:excisionase family DNA binding protein
MKGISSDAPAIDRMVDSGELLTTREVARLAGVGPSAVKRWSDSGVLPCQRTAGGHRRFARAEVERMLRHQAGGAAAGPDPWVDALLGAPENFACASLLLSERGRTGAWYRVAERVGGAVAELGRRWRAGTASILEEHLISERLARTLARTVESIALPPAAPVALLTCAVGDDHTLGLSLVELVLREAGWSTLWAGRRTPLEEIERLLGRGEVRLLAVSASEASSDAAGLRRLATALGRRCRALDVSLVLGGQGAWPERPRHGQVIRSLLLLHEFAVLERELRARPPVG